ncbi:hypothetical protein FQN55_000107 [Onygenales sp. PD_40]|nr:hypothetical protein FQN55_000107 [Onygenales sp. PD_40]
MRHHFFLLLCFQCPLQTLRDVMRHRCTPLREQRISSCSHNLIPALRGPSTISETPTAAGVGDPLNYRD